MPRKPKPPAQGFRPSPSGPIAWLLYLLPFAAALVFVMHYSTNVPFMDQWSLVGLFDAVAHRHGIVAELLRCNNEHPVLFPKLIWIALAFLTKWNVRADMVATVLSMGVIFIACAWMALKERPRNPGWPTTVSVGVTSLLLFSFVHSDTFLGGYQLSFTMANAAPVAAIWSLSAFKARPIRGLILAWLCCIVGSFSSLHGMLAWIVVLPCLLPLFESRRARVLAAGATCLLCAASIAVYYFAFTNVTAPSDHSYWHKHPVVAAKFFLAILGLPLTERSVETAQLVAAPIGAVVVLLFVAGGYYLIRNLRWREALPWISIGLFALGFAGMTSLGRASGGLLGAVTSNRYTSCTVLLIVATLHLWRQILSDRASSRVAFLGLALLASGTGIVASVTSIPVVRTMAQDRTRAANCLEVIDYIDSNTDNHWEGCFFPLVPMEQYVYLIRQPAETLGALGWRKIAKQVPFIDNPAASYGWIDSGKPAIVRPNDWIYCSGWAIIPGEDRLPKSVLFSVGDAHLFIYQVPVGTLLRPDVAAFTHREVTAKSGWAAWIPAKFLTPGASELVAWAFDEQKQEFVRLQGSKLVSRAGTD